MTKKQQELLDFIKRYMPEHGSAPTLREMAEFMGTTSAAAQFRLRTLVLKGFIIKKPNTPRSIALNDRSESKSVHLPVLGVISAGDGISVFEEPDPDFVEVSITMVRTDAPYYCLKVDGNSMLGDGIMNNDYIVVRQQNDVNNGEIAVAIISDDPDEKANLKRLYKHEDQIELRPNNPDSAYQPKFYRRSQIHIRGKYCGLIRKNE
ncbi:MAG: transcriptional repressor LexA [Patescibacteria group bacterium]